MMTVLAEESRICLDPAFLGSASIGLVAVGMIIGALMMVAGRR